LIINKQEIAGAELGLESSNFGMWVTPTTSALNLLVWFTLFCRRWKPWRNFRFCKSQFLVTIS